MKAVIHKLMMEPNLATGQRVKVEKFRNHAIFGDMLNLLSKYGDFYFVSLIM